MNTNVMYKNAEIVVAEMANTNNGKKGSVEVDFATWLIGTLDVENGVLYGHQISAGDLMEDGEILKVSVLHCQKGTPSHAGLESYIFSTEADQLPSECYQLKHVRMEELPESIQDAICAALEAFETQCPRMAS